MEYLQARLDSFKSTTTKSKRAKASSSKQASASKWPHPPTWKATPDSLAEAGFYYSPGPNELDNVKCFMCKKNLCNWEPEDDPFEIHYQKCSNVCAWAVVRCQKPHDDGSYEIDGSTRQPTSKAMEKARLDTFSMVRWPHDGVRGHGASSRALAKAGFVCSASEPGDDTAICLYCNLTLSGWDEEDDPYEEHMKRDTKNGSSCPFLKAYIGGSLTKSTSKRATGRSVSKPPSRAGSHTVDDPDVQASQDESDDELAAPPSSGAVPSKGPSTRKSKSMSSRASSVPVKTPASRRSTRGTTATGKTPGSRHTVSSEVEDTDVGSESEMGKRASKSKRKTGGRTKARVSAIAEEEGEEVPGATQQDDAEMPAEEPVKEEKRKRGRPPKNTAVSKAAPKSKAKKTAEVEEGDDMRDTEVEADPAPPPAKKAHARTRSKANLDSEPEAPVAPATSKPTHTRTKSGPRVKVKQEEDEEAPALAPAPKRKGKQKAVAEVEQNEDNDAPPPPLKGKGKALAVARSKAKLEPESQPPEIVSGADEGAPVRERTKSGRSTSSHVVNTSPQRTPSLSDDAGYATAEAPPEVERMDVDEEEPSQPPPRPLRDSRNLSAKGTQPDSRRSDTRSTPQVDEDAAPKRLSPAVNGSTYGASGPPSRASSSRPLAKVPSQRSANSDSLKVVEIDSDGEMGSPEPPRKPDAVKKTASVNGPKKPASKVPSKKFQVEVVVPHKTAPSHSESADVHMQDTSPTSPVRSKVARSISPVRPAQTAEPSTPVSAVHRSAQVSPARPEAADPQGENVVMQEAAPVAATSTSPRTYHPVLAQIPIEKLTSLTEQEAEMTLEQYIRRETELQYAQFKADAERKIAEFKAKAAEARKLMEAS
ncbi:hypothetical protein BD413DRAFT_467956 [Trametes elegans]|nr:hypothetical protein BD413DRAFT_467956 [Trametes elegans]